MYCTFAYNQSLDPVRRTRARRAARGRPARAPDVTPLESVEYLGVQGPGNDGADDVRGGAGAGEGETWAGAVPPGGEKETPGDAQ